MATGCWHRLGEHSSRIGRDGAARVTA